MRYREVLRAPIWTYGVLAGLVALFCFTFAAVITVPFALVLFVVLMALGAVVISRRNLRLSVDDEQFTVGGQSLPLADIDDVHALDAPALRMAAGPDADTRAHLVLRNLATKTGVKVDLADGPVPYWLVSSSRPEDLAEALSRR